MQKRSNNLARRDGEKVAKSKKAWIGEWEVGQPVQQLRSWKKVVRLLSVLRYTLIKKFVQNGLISDPLRYLDYSEWYAWGARITQSHFRDSAMYPVNSTQNALGLI